jgi:hypothetical protein
MHLFLLENQLKKSMRRHILRIKQRPRNMSDVP